MLSVCQGASTMGSTLVCLKSLLRGQHNDIWYVTAHLGASSIVQDQKNAAVGNIKVTYYSETKAAHCYVFFSLGIGNAPRNPTLPCPLRRRYLDRNCRVSQSTRRSFVLRVVSRRIAVSSVALVELTNGCNRLVARGYFDISRDC